MDSNPSDPNDPKIWANWWDKRIDTTSVVPGSTDVVPGSTDTTPVEPGPGTYKRYGGKKRTRKYKNGKKTMKKNKGKRGTRY